MRRLLLLGFIWGWSFLFIKVAVDGMTPTTVACLRVALGAAVLHLWLRRKGLSLPRDRTTWLHFAFVGSIGSAVPFTLLAWGEERITSALTAVVNASTPLFTAVAAAALLGERLRSVQLLGLAAGFVGVGVAAGIGVADLTGSSLAGVGASTLAGLCYGLSVTWMRRHLTGIPPVVAAAGQLTAATMLLTPFAATTTLVDGFDVTARRLVALIILGVVGTGVAYLLFYRVVADLGATRASLVTYVVPAVAVTVGVVFLDEPFAARIVLGALLIVAGIVFVNGTFTFSWPRRVPPLVPVLLVAVLAFGVLPACGDDDGGGSAGGCADEVRETLDPASATHVLPGGVEPQYLSDPPTSGPHIPAPAQSGVFAQSFSRPQQVGHLEAGGVLLQFQPDDVTGADLTALEGLAGDRVAVVPNSDLDDPVVATAWLVKQTCQGVEAEALRTFVAAHRGSGPGID
jgi:drug/metabolite transporter (DMT)-like permease